MKLYLFLFVTLFFINACVSQVDESSTLSHFIINGNEQAKNGYFYQALDEYQKAYDINPNYEILLRNMAIVNVKIHEYKKSLEFFSQVKNQYFDDEEFFYYYGEAFRALDFQSEAIECYKKAIAISSDDLRPKKSLAFLYYQRGEISLSEKMILSVYEEDKNDLQAMTILGKIYNQKKMYAETILTFTNFEKTHFKVFGEDFSQNEKERSNLLNILGEAYIGQGSCEKGLSLFKLATDIKPHLNPNLANTTRCNLKEIQSLNAIDNYHHLK